MIDLHAHVLPGIDDGPPDMESSLALLRAAHADGVRTVVATPHVDDRWDNDAAGIAAGVAALQQAARADGIEIKVHAGAEIAITRMGDLDDDALRALALGGGPNLLMESPLSSAAGDFDFLIESLLDRGHGVVLAHPERCPIFQREPERLTRLVACGTRCSVTASALTGRFGETVRRFSHRLLRERLVHDLASDAHDLAGRRPEIAGPLLEAQKQLPGLDGLAGWLTQDAPAALLKGWPVGAPPVRLAPHGVGRGLGRLRRRAL